MTESKEKKSLNKELEEKLFYKKKSSWTECYKENQDRIFAFAQEYKDFIGKSKTERLCIKHSLELLEKHGFKNIDECQSLERGSKVYKNIKGKSLMAAIIGDTVERLSIIGSHGDSPRLDLKPTPLYEEAEVSLLQSHYYGGIKKFHWVNTPLELHGVAFTKENKEVEIHIGGNTNDPKFIIPDLLPHLAKEQMKKESSKLIEGEDLNIICGHIPIDDKEIKESIKFNILKYLNENYGLVEEDFICAELEFVPAQEPIDIGFDRGLVGAYGQDDKICVFASLKAILECENPANTPVLYISDKEETGSNGDTGAESFALVNFTSDILRLTKNHISPFKVLEKSRALSADVTCAMNPSFSSVNDPKNASYLGMGISIEKYGGGGGKYSTNDAHAEYMQFIRKLANDNDIPWQSGEMGKIDIGGGGTIAMFMSRYGMDCVDAGPCMLAMHSDCEVASKADLYSAFRLYGVFFKS